MKRRNFREEDILIAAVAVVALAGIFALLKRVPRAFTARVREHPFLRIEKELIRDYLDKEGKRIKFKFINDNGRVKLRFIGSLNFVDRVTYVTMNTADSQTKALENLKFGKFKKDTNKQRLHDILTQEPLTDWILEPLPCDLDNRYVAYDLRSEGEFPQTMAASQTMTDSQEASQTMSASQSMAVYRINPCPPGCR